MKNGERALGRNLLLIGLVAHCCPEEVGEIPISTVRHVVGGPGIVTEGALFTQQPHFPCSTSWDPAVFSGAWSTVAVGAARHEILSIFTEYTYKLSIRACIRGVSRNFISGNVSAVFKIP